MSKNQKMVNVFNALNDRVIAFHVGYAQITGSITCGLLLSQLIYWAKTKNYEEFWKTNEQLCEELCMGREELKLAKKRLIKLGFVSAKLKGLPAKTFYEVNRDKIIETLSKTAAPSSGRETRQLAGGKPANWRAGNPPTIIDKITTEITTDTNAREIGKIQGRKKPGSFEKSLDRFWAAYPKKFGKPLVIRSLKAALKKTDIETILKSLRFFVDDIGRNGTAPRFIIAPHRWLDNERWTDEYVNSTAFVEETAPAEIEKEIKANSKNSFELTIRSSLLNELGLRRYISWFRQVDIEKRGDLTFFKCPNKFHRDWISTHHKDTIMLVLQNTLGKDKILGASITLKGNTND